MMEKVTDMLLRIMDRSMEKTPTSTGSGTVISNMDFGMLATKIEKSREKDTVKQTEKGEKMERIRSKVMAIGRMNKMLKSVRENREEIV